MKFWLFILITTIRQVPQIYLELTNRRKKIISRGNITTAIMYFGYIAIWIICLIRLLHYTPRTIYFIGGGIILILGVMFRFVSLYYLGRQYSGNMAIYENHKLISDGIYKYLRHPLHLALIIELAGMIIYSESWKLLFLWIILFITVLVRNKTEDEFIVKIFREKALDYQNKTSSMNIFQVFSKSKRRLKKNKKT